MSLQVYWGSHDDRKRVTTEKNEDRMTNAKPIRKFYTPKKIVTTTKKRKLQYLGFIMMGEICSNYYKKEIFKCEGQSKENGTESWEMLENRLTVKLQKFACQWLLQIFDRRRKVK